jgi:hypothetical protein
MKYYETHFEEYISENQRENLHPKLDKIYGNFPATLQDLKNIIFYGPSGVGKYTQMLRAIKKYSPSELKYEKKISVTFNKDQYFYKISDIHYEVDMSLLGCNSKLLWHEIYLQIIDIISAKTEKSGIIVCKYFQEIHNELLEIFYSYMQKNSMLLIDLKFILITEEISFIPDNIINCCFIINVPRPPKTNYIKSSIQKFNVETKLQKDFIKCNLENITNIKILNLKNEELMLNYKVICNKIIDNIINVKDIHFLKFRDILYDIFIYNLDITECIWYILSTLIEKEKIKINQLTTILIKTYNFFQYYNNNYRPIYHLENYVYNLIKIIHQF